MGGPTWRTDCVLPTFPTPGRLDVVEVERSSPAYDLLLTTLQGVINRRRPRVYLARRATEGAYTWLRELDVPYEIRHSPRRVVERYHDELEGLTVYDPAVPATVNLATTLAGVHDAPVASPALARSLTAEFDLDVVRDLRDEFEGALDAYRWQREEYAAATTDRLLVGLDPDQSDPDDDPEYDPLVEVTGTATVDLSEFVGRGAVLLRVEPPATGGRASRPGEITVEADGHVIASFEPGTAAAAAFRSGAGDSTGPDTVYRFDPPSGTGSLLVRVDGADGCAVSARAGEPASGAGLDPVTNLRDYAVATGAATVWLNPNDEGQRSLFVDHLAETDGAYAGWFMEGVGGEFEGVELCSAHAVPVVPADFLDNATVLAGIGDGTRNDRTPVFPERPDDLRLEEKVYVTVTMTEGDNLQYNQHRLRELWDAPDRGAVPINWSISPLLADAAPALLEYYRRTATHNDHLICGPSGAGYAYPSAWPDDAFGTFAETTGRYTDRAGLDTMYLLNRTDGTDVELSPSAVRRYCEAVDPRGVVANFWPGREAETTVLADELPWAVGPFVESAAEMVSTVREAAPADRSGDGPAFLALGSLAWAMGPGEIREAVDSLPSGYEFVTADVFFELFRECHGRDR